MTGIAEDVTELIGRIPLVKLSQIGRERRWSVT